jgi:hypothetical protein
MRRRRLDCEPLESRRIMLSLELPQRADPLLVEVQTEPRKISIDHIGLCLEGPEETKNWAGSHMMAKLRLTNVGTGSASFRGAGG